MWEKFGKNGAKLGKMDAKQFKSIADDFGKRTKASLDRTTGSRLMKDYSPWLSGFQANQHSEVIEIPGEGQGCEIWGSAFKMPLGLRVCWKPAQIPNVYVRTYVCMYAGQYDGQSKPLPEYHTKISGFDEKVH